MRKERFLLTLSAFTLVIFLYQLPKIVVNNKEGDSTSVEAMEGDIHHLIQRMHPLPLSEADNQKVTLWKKALAQMDNSEKGIKFADSLARMFRRHNELDSAAKYTEVIAQLLPTKESYLNAGNAYYEAFSLTVNAEKLKSLGEKARIYYDKVLEEKPDDLEIQAKVAMTYMATENPMQGIAMLRGILAQDPYNQLALKNMGLLSMQSKQYDKAVQRFEKVVYLYAEDVEARLYLALSYLALGEKIKAKSHLNFVKERGDAIMKSTAASYLNSLS